jgi:hypothetical protein
MKKKIIKIGEQVHDITDQKCFKNYHTSQIGSSLPYQEIDASFISNTTFNLILKLCGANDKSAIISQIKSLNKVLDLFIAIDYFQLEDTELPVILYTHYRKLLIKQGLPPSTKMTDLYELLPQHIQQRINSIISKRVKKTQILPKPKLMKIFAKLTKDFKSEKINIESRGISREPNLRIFYDNPVFLRIKNDPSSKEIAVIYWHDYAWLCFGMKIDRHHQVVCNKYNIQDFAHDIISDAKTIQKIVDNDYPIRGYYVLD